MAVNLVSGHASIIHIDLKNNPVDECGAIFVTILVEPFNCARQAELHASLCAFSLRARLTDNDKSPIAMKPCHAFRDQKLMVRHVKTIAKQLGRRMSAARMAIALLQAMVCEPDQMTLPASVKRLSINQLAEFVLDDAGENDPDNVEKRIWRPSLPVIHLAVAAAVHAQEVSRMGGVNGLERLLWSRDSIETIVRHAQAYEPLILACPKINVSADKLVRVRLT